MKKLFALILAACILTLAACGNAEKAETPSEATSPDSLFDLVGGWQTAESPELSEEIRQIYDKAMFDYDTGEYEPLALISTQVVAGMNYRFLCLRTIIYDSCAKDITYSLINVYKDLDGNASVTDIIDSENYAGFSEAPGGWFRVSSPALKEEVRTAFDKAAARAELKPVALVAEQVVAGMNYRLLCEDGNSYTFVNVYADLEGNAQITEEKPFAPLL